MKNRRLVIFILIIIFSFETTACTGSATNQRSNQPSHKTEQLIGETAITTATSVPTMSSTPEPQVVKPTETPWPPLLSSETPAAFSEINSSTPYEQFQLTLQAKAVNQTKIASFSPICDDANYWTSMSPNGEWLALSCGYKIDQNMQVNSKTGKKWILLFKNYVSKEFILDGYPPMGALYPVHWTKDEKYLFFTSAIGFSGGGTCFYGGDGQGLYRLNLENGTVSAMLAPLSGAGDYLISFSPNGRWLAYTAGVPTIFDIQTGESIVLHEGKNDVGDFTWSPDGSILVYGTCRPSEDSLSVEKSSIKFFSMHTRKSNTILESLTGLLRMEAVERNRLKIYYEESTSLPDLWYFEWSSRQLITPALTPTP